MKKRRKKKGLFLKQKTDRDITVVLDTNFTPELIEEGFIREIISKAQTMRKESNCEVQDHINFFVEGNARVEDIVMRNASVIAEEVLGKNISIGSGRGYSKEWNINGEKVKFTVEKV